MYVSILKPRLAHRPESWGTKAGDVRGFTLIELMVVVVIITLLAAIAAPGINKRLRSYKARAQTEEIASIYRTARLKAMGRGAAVLVRFDTDSNSFEVREGIQGVDASDNAGAGECRSLPATSCTIPSDRWDNEDRSQQTSIVYYNSEEYGVTAHFLSPADTSTELTRNTLDICYTPLGHAYADMATAGVLAPMTTAPRFDVVRSDAVGLARSVLISTVGPTRVVADE